MKLLSIAAAGLGLAIAGSAIAGERASDAQYIKANRCRALATADSLGPMDTAAIDAFLKAEGRTRNSAVVTMAQEEQSRARREARSPEGKARLQAELSGPCLAYLQPSGASGQP